MKRLVVRSIEDWSGQRCVDVRREPDGLFSWAECRRDPEDAHGWRFLGVGAEGFSGEAEATADAVASVAWMEDT
ncbi:hypothetical protein [Jannaschia sp. CCS1]|uniref:hypothetical protein n=1 Tax=Jannaschia sp. (strain CCS1) TaxID=290400 RepID=UPI00006C00C9|nr:hypothetical protein [Jannaschia sp. CCS1]ABD56333.1 hypothetical protein Jann_3416 [Jannaschia sp. CCS1]